MKLAPTALAHLVIGAACAVQADAAVVIINQNSFTFSPLAANASVGDTIRWVWHGGGHTVTSGANCNFNGLFDGDLSTAIQSFEWVVPASVAGTTVAYFCMPHCFSGMVGSIVVAPMAAPGDLNSDGLVNGLDLTQLLGAWGTADAASDINDDGVVNAVDLSVILANWTQ